MRIAETPFRNTALLHKRLDLITLTVPALPMAGRAGHDSSKSSRTVTRKEHHVYCNHLARTGSSFLGCIW